MIKMKRFSALLLTLLLILPVGFYARAEDTPQVYSYDFDLWFHMNADIFPARQRNHMQGYADLLNMLGLKGNLTYCPSTRSFDLNAEIIPRTNPDASVSFRLYGIPEHIGMSSPLLGNETIWFQNLVMMEFAFKTWNNLRIPLQHIAVLYPYVTESAFQQMAAAWNRRFSSSAGSVSFPRQELASLAEEWDGLLHDDSRLKFWIYSMSMPAHQGDVMETEFYRLPDYMLSRVFPEGGLTLTRNSGCETWSNALGDVLYTQSSESGSLSWTFSLPATENGYLPYLAVDSRMENGIYSLSLNGSYNLAETQEDRDSSLPESLCSISLQMDGWPGTWPADAGFTASLDIGGAIYPNTAMTVLGTSSADGKLALTLSQPLADSGELIDVFSCGGTIVPARPKRVPSYIIDDFSSLLAIYNVSDKTMDDFVHRIRRPLFLGLLNFLNELPARSCQSVMDDLEDYGILDMVLVD